MRTRTAGLGMLAALALVASACGSSGTPAPSGGAGGASSTLKIGLVTDVGKLNDQNFNQYSWEGAQAGATAIGAPAPKAVQSQASADIHNNIQSLVDQKFDIIVTVGFAATADSTAADWSMTTTTSTHYGLRLASQAMPGRHIDVNTVVNGDWASGEAIVNAWLDTPTGVIVFLVMLAETTSTARPQLFRAPMM